MKCECTLATGCGEEDAAGCDYCRTIDIYLPCPVFGFMCGLGNGCGDVDDPCCTPEQQEMTRRYYA